MLAFVAIEWELGWRKKLIKEAKGKSRDFVLHEATLWHPCRGQSGRFHSA